MFRGDEKIFSYSLVIVPGDLIYESPQGFWLVTPDMTTMARPLRAISGNAGMPQHAGVDTGR